MYSYLDALFHTIDGNFVSNQKDKKRDLEDFPLTAGAAYFVDERNAKILMDNQGPLVIEVSIELQKLSEYSMLP